MKHNLKYSICIIFLLAIRPFGQAFAQIPVRSGSASIEEQKKALAKVDSNLDNLEAHKAYIYAMGIHNPRVTEQYKAWMKKYPKNANIPLAIGTVYYNAEMAQAREFLLRVVAMQPKNAKVWSMLSADAERWGQNDLSIRYMRKASLADSSDADYAFYYLMSFADSDPDDYKNKVFDFVKRFPTNKRGSQALYWLGEKAANLKDKINYFEELRKRYPPQKFDWSASGMIGLADAYLQTDPEKALALINEMEEDKDWKLRKQTAELLIQVNKLEEDQNYQQAIIKIEQVKLPRFNHLDDFIALKKIALEEKNGDVKTAYDSLVMRFAKVPTDYLYNELELLRSKTGKSNEQVVKDIWTIRNRETVAAPPFTLGLYTTNGKLALNDLKGKVVLLTFWFPGCGPCRAEFPHFQTVINEFKDQNVVYIGINVTPEQDPYVIPFMQNTKYSFIPLRGSVDFAAKYYGVQGEPENFLIDKNGNIVFRNFSVDNTNHRTLELMISSLLQKN